MSHNMYKFVVGLTSPILNFGLTLDLEKKAKKKKYQERK